MKPEKGKRGKRCSGSQSEDPYGSGRDPDSRYFERAILFVRQGDWAPKEIDEQAEQYLRAASEEMGRTRTAAPSATLLKERVGLRKLLFRAGAAAGLLLLAAALVLL